MANALIESRVTNLESMMADLMATVAQTSRTVEQLSLEMRDFKQEMAEFKDEMRDFKQEMAEFKDEMRDFKGEMAEFKDEMRDWRDKTDAALEEGRRERRAFNKQLGEIANKQGRMAEDIVAPSICRILREVLGFPEDDICVANVRVRRRHPRGKTVKEFDVIAECNDYVLVNETKSRLSPSDVKKLLKTVKTVREYFPEFRDRRIIGSLATLYVDASLIKHATNQGVLVLAVGDELMDVMNPAGFKPREL